MSDDDEDETQIAHKRDLIPDDMETIPEGRAQGDDDEETRVAKKSSLLPADMQDMDLGEDSLTQRRQRIAPIRPAAGSRPGLVAPRVAEAPRYRPPQAERATPAQSQSPQPPQQQQQQPPQQQQQQQQRAQQAQPQPQPQERAHAQPPQAAQPEAPRPRAQPATISAPVALGPPRVFVLVLVACAIFSATGGGLLLYLKMRHLW